MSISFKWRYIPLIRLGLKTETRRLRRPRLRVGGIYPLRVGRRLLPDRVRILNIYPQRLGDVTEEDAHREGFQSLGEFRKAWLDIYHSWDDEQQIWVIEFRYLGERFKE
ncbi:ASCH domain-containing protein [Candidatus Bathyarchaeota archaeon]|nr:ASCH domain-containing protein [Candidatus Bathyarchaeota archaeon]